MKDKNGKNLQVGDKVLYDSFESVGTTLPGTISHFSSLEGREVAFLTIDHKQDLDGGGKYRGRYSEYLTKVE